MSDDDALDRHHDLVAAKLDELARNPLVDHASVVLARQTRMHFDRTIACDHVGWRTVDGQSHSVRFDVPG